MFSTKAYDREFLEAANASHRHELVFLEPRLTPETAALAEGFPAVCAFVNDRLDAEVLRHLAGAGTHLVVLRSAGFNHVDLVAAARLGITVARVPSYSPEAVAEHAVALILALARRMHRAYNRVREGNFSLEGLLGTELHGRTVGTVGTGRIGGAFARIMAGFGCRLLAVDTHPDPDCLALGVGYVALDELLGASDVIALHAPLTPETHHLIDAAALSKVKRGVILVNTSRGALVDTRAVIEALKDGTIGMLGLDVYEEEADLFFRDLSHEVIRDDVFTRLLTFPNVLITAHQAFFTEDAMRSIAETTLGNVTAFDRGEGTLHQVTADSIA